MLRRRGLAPMLTLGAAAVLLALAAIAFANAVREYRYDTHVPDGRHLYRLAAHWVSPDGGQSATWATTPRPIARILNQTEGRLTAAFHAPVPVPIDVEGRQHAPDGAYFVSRDALAIWKPVLLAGDPDDFGPGRALVTRAMAVRLFGTTEALGRVLTARLASHPGDGSFVVSGILPDWPEHSHIDIQALIGLFRTELAAAPTSGPEGKPADKADLKPDLKAADKAGEARLDREWRAPPGYTYVRTADGTPPDPAALQALVESHAPSMNGWRLVLEAQPLNAIHLSAPLQDEPGRPGSAAVTSMVLSLAVLLLLLAATAYWLSLEQMRFLSRQETLIRRWLGQDARQRLRDRLTLTGLHAAMTTVGGAFLSVGGLWAGAVADWWGAASWLGMGFVLFVLVGAASALTATLRSGQERGITPRVVRRLTGAQGGLVAALGVACAVMVAQSLFLDNRPLGYRTADILVLHGVHNPTTAARAAALQAAIAAVPGVQAVAGSAAAPPEIPASRFLEVSIAGPQGGGRLFRVNTAAVDRGFRALYDIPLLAGEDFPSTGPALSDRKPGQNRELPVMLNASAAALLGGDAHRVLGMVLQAQIGKDDQLSLRVFGTVGDFVAGSPRNGVEPMIFFWAPEQIFRLSVRLVPGLSDTALRAALDGIDDAWARVLPTQPLTRVGIVDLLRLGYAAEREAGSLLLSGGPAMAGSVVLMGLGLASFLLNVRRRQVGMQLVLGAGWLPVFSHMVRTPLQGWLAGSALAAPPALIVAILWLQEFAVHFDPWTAPFLGSLALAAGAGPLMILAAVSAVQAFRLCRRGPGAVLRADSALVRHA